MLRVLMYDTRRPTSSLERTSQAQNTCARREHLVQCDFLA